MAAGGKLFTLRDIFPAALFAGFVYATNRLVTYYNHGPDGTGWTRQTTSPHGTSGVQSAAGASGETGHDILPIYDQNNKLIGFTHPKLVAEAEVMRDKHRGKVAG
jgi:hypothetical protein